MSRLHLTAEQRGPTTVVFLTGHVDSNTAPDLHHFVKDLNKNDQWKIVLDLHEIGYISSAGMGSMLQCAQAVREKRGDLRLARANPNVKKLINLLGFGTLLEHYESIDEAVDAFG